jgi:hypothetical protein
MDEWKEGTKMDGQIELWPEGRWMLGEQDER